MICQSCQCENEADARFCERCGLPIELRCPSCGAAVGTQARFCRICGHDLALPASDPPHPAGQVPPPDSHPGERRHATVLFSDLSGYTAMNERLDPEVVRSIMARIKADAVRIVEGHGGIVNQFVGDEVVALFGVPTAHEDDPVRAVRAAQDLHAMVRALSSEVEDGLGATLRLHSGISTGLVVTGTEDRRDGTVGVTGDTVNTGARLASHAASGTVLVSEETQRAVADYFQVEPLAPVSLKGKGAKITPYRVVEQTGVSSRFEAAAQRGFTAYTGRESELQALHDALEKARAGQGQFVTVTGEPGIGKSRLLFEFRHGVPRDRATVLTGYCQSYGTNTAYLPFVDAMRRGLRLDEAHGTDALHDHAVNAVRAVSPKLEGFLPQYLHLLSVPSERHGMPAELQGDALRSAIEEAIAAFITENARRQPLVLILEDWHWADDASDSALNHLASLVPHHPLLVIVAYRPEYERTAANPECYRPLVLRPLGEQDTAAMLRAVWGAWQLPDGLAAQVHARTDGNPLFNEEVARGLLDDGTVRIEERRALLAGTLEDLHLPDTVNAVIRARIDRLDPDARDVLRLASVIGREFVVPVLERLHTVPRPVPTALDGLARQGLIYPLRVVPEPAYLFKHALVQKVVYDTLLLSQRKELHAKTGRVIEALYRDRIEEHYEALAEHYSQSDNHAKAVEFLEKAGDKAVEYYSLGDAREYFARAYRLLAMQEATADRQDARIAMILKWSKASHYAPDPEQTGQLEICLGFAESKQQKRRSAELTEWIGHAYYYAGRHNVAHRHALRLLELASEINDERMIARSHYIIGRNHMLRGEYDEGLAILERGLPLLQGIEDQAGVAEATYYLGMILGWIGRFADAWRLLRDSLDTSIAIRNRTREAATRFGSAIVRLIASDWEMTLRLGDETIELARRIGNQYLETTTRWTGGIARVHLGEWQEGLDALREAAKVWDAGGEQFTTLTTYYGWMAECCVLADAIDDAAVFASKGMQHAENGDRSGEAIALRVMGMVAACGAGPDGNEARSYLDRAVQLSRERGERPFLAVACFRYAEVLHKNADTLAALEQLADSERLFSDMEMAWWNEQAAALRARIEGGQPFAWFAPYVDGPPRNEGQTKSSAARPVRS